MHTKIKTIPAPHSTHVAEPYIYKEEHSANAIGHSYTSIKHSYTSIKHSYTGVKHSCTGVEHLNYAKKAVTVRGHSYLPQIPQKSADIIFKKKIFITRNTMLSIHYKKLFSCKNILIYEFVASSDSI